MSKRTNNLHTTSFKLPKYDYENLQQLHKQYLFKQVIGTEYITNEQRLRARNVLYISTCLGLSRRQTMYFVDLFRQQIKCSFMAFSHFITAFNIDASLIFNHDLVIEEIKAGLLHPDFNYNTYKLPTDLIEQSPVKPYSTDTLIGIVNDK